jgi:branched-chain amino acid transport system permease protein
MCAMTLQVLINGLAEAAILFVAGLSFLLIYRVSRVFHFAHASVLACAPYTALVLTATLGINPLIGCSIGLAVGAVIGVLIQCLVYEPLGKRGSGPLVALIASLGVYIAVQNTMSLAVGDQTQSLGMSSLRQTLQIGSATVSWLQMIAAGIAVCVGASFLVATKHLRVGRLWGAVVSDSGLATVCGIDTRRVVRWTFVVGSVIGGLAGVLVGLDIDVSPTMGMNMLLLSVIAVLIGNNSVVGMAVGALLIGFARNSAAWLLPGQWRDGAAFAVLFLVLVIRSRVFTAMLMLLQRRLRA